MAEKLTPNGLVVGLILDKPARIEIEPEHQVEKSFESGIQTEVTNEPEHQVEEVKQNRRGRKPKSEK